MLGLVIRYLILGDFQSFILVAIVLLLALSLHEFGHALAAELQGDHTARLAGRLTLNPAAHIDPFGALAMVLVGFGWGKPVPFSPRALRSPRFGSAIVGIAGPLVNVALAFLAAILIRVVHPDLEVFARFLAIMLYLNVLLAVFNLFPIPPLDGSRILSALLPPSKQRFLFFMDKWGMLILIVAIFLVPGVFGRAAYYFEGIVRRLVGIS